MATATVLEERSAVLHHLIRVRHEIQGIARLYSEHDALPQQRRRGQANPVQRAQHGRPGAAAIALAEAAVQARRCSKAELLPRSVSAAAPNDGQCKAARATQVTRGAAAPGAAQGE